MKRLLTAMAVSIQLVILFGMGVGSGLAGGDCVPSHRVVAGETLAGIADRYGVTVQALVERNGIANPDLIRTGQKLCVPVQRLPTIEAENRAVEPTGDRGSSAQPQLDLVAEFRLTDKTPAGEPSNRWRLMRAQPLGLRYSLALVAGSAEEVRDSIFQTGSALRTASAADTPILWLIPNVPNLDTRLSPTYTLALMGDPAPFLSLQFGLTPTQVITELLTVSDRPGGGFGSSACQIVRNPVNVLGASSGAEVQMRAELGVGNGSYIGYTVTHLTYWSSRKSLPNCTGTEVALALQSQAVGNGYRLLLAMPRSTGGPTVGESTDADCDEWEGLGGIFAILRVIWRCPA